MTVRLSMTANCLGSGVEVLSQLGFDGLELDQKPLVKPVRLMRL